MSSASEVAAYLSELQRERTPVQLSSPSGHGLNSRIQVFDPTAGLLAFEVGMDPQGASHHLVDTSEVTAVAYLGSIKLQFDLDSPVLVSGDQGAVLRCGIPERLYRFQRRQTFRVQPAGQLFPRVLLPCPDGSHQAFRVLDISIGGLALQRLPQTLALATGEVYPAAQLELDRTTQLEVALRIQHVSEWRGPEATHWHVGCAFMDLQTSVLRALQVYVDQTQKRRRLLKLDL